VRVKLVVNEPTLCRPTEKPSGEQVGVGRLAEGAAELAAEVGAREARGAGQVIHVERLEVPGVGQVLGAQEVAGGGDEGHARSVLRAAGLG
jgi:hypothetical protein